MILEPGRQVCFRLPWAGPAVSLIHFGPNTLFNPPVLHNVQEQYRWRYCPNAPAIIFNAFIVIPEPYSITLKTSSA